MWLSMRVHSFLNLETYINISALFEISLKSSPVPLALLCDALLEPQPPAVYTQCVQLECACARPSSLGSSFEAVLAADAVVWSLSSSELPRAVGCFFLFLNHTWKTGMMAQLGPDQR